MVAGNESSSKDTTIFFGTGDLLGSKSTQQLHAVGGKNNKYFQFVTTIKKRKNTTLIIKDELENGLWTRMIFCRLSP